MTTVYIADTGVFVRCGGPDNEKFQRLRNAVTQAGATLLIPQRVYEELGGDPDIDEYPSGEIGYATGIEDGWIEVAEGLDYTNPTVATVMDEARRFIASETDRPEDRIEKADTALCGLAAQRLEADHDTSVVLLTTDKPAGRAAESLLPKHGFESRIEYRYVSPTYLETLSVDEFRE